MTDEKRLIRISKFLSKYLRHAPHEIGLELDTGGWVAVDDLIAASVRAGFHYTRAELDEVVATNSKQRFSFDESGTRIRANQGHSVEVDLELPPATPPDVLYHGTAEKNVDAILESGLVRMKRHHVHLSRDVETARAVGSRHGRPVVLEVDAAAMTAAGHVFYLSENKVWLTDEVPARFLKKVSGVGFQVSGEEPEANEKEA